jgi:hypothetical protein
MIARVDSRTKTERGQRIDLAIDGLHCHLFDKETEITILARNQENMQEIVELQAKRVEEDAIKAQEEAAKLAAEEEKARLKMERKLGNLFKKKEKAPAEETTEEVASEDADQE